MQTPRSLTCRCSNGTCRRGIDTGNARVARESGFTLLELMVVTVLIATVAAFAMPTVTTVKMADNETAMLGALRTIFLAQTQVRVAAVIDSDRNGGGEYGFFQELSGKRKLRIDSDADGIADADGSSELSPPAILSDFADVDGTGLIQRGGYFLRMYLPDADLDWVPEPGPSASYADVSAFHAMGNWACYAWPRHCGKTGQRAFFINESGRILACTNDVTRYSGATTVPDPKAVLFPGGSGKMDDRLATELIGEDGNTWRIVR